MSIHFESSLNPESRFKTGVSLHSHTTHSKESLSFVYRYAAEVPILAAAIKRGERQYRDRHEGRELDFGRAWWTPPLSPHDAWKLEKGQIEDRFGMSAIVSLSDHDDIEAGMALQVLSECQGTPVSVEWTVPFRGTFFHIGVHNLPVERARDMMARFAEVTANATEDKIREAFEWIAESKETLVVFNHPCWDENAIGAENHRIRMVDFARMYRKYLHALELNGLRPWSENHRVVEFAEETRFPLISGGDRHALEANVILNMTNAKTFVEFGAEIQDGHSEVLLTDQYFESFKLRILQSIAEILDGRWTDRVYYLCDDGVVRNMSELFVSGQPAAVRVFTRGVQLLRKSIDWVKPFAPKAPMPKLPAFRQPA